jgi:hypothetical protein
MQGLSPPDPAFSFRTDLRLIPILSRPIPSSPRSGIYAFSRYELGASHPLHLAVGDALRTASMTRVSAVLGGRRVKGVRRYTVTALGPRDFVGLHVDDGRHGDVAFELGLSLEWGADSGGSLVVCPRNQSLAEARKHATISDDVSIPPAFNTITVMPAGPHYPPLPFRVEAMAANAPRSRPRLAVTGWLDVDPMPPGARDYRPTRETPHAAPLRSGGSHVGGSHAGGSHPGSGHAVAPHTQHARAEAAHGPTAASPPQLLALPPLLLLLSCLCLGLLCLIARARSPVLCGAFRSLIALGGAAPRRKE